MVNLALPALRQMRADEFQKFSATLAWLIESDEQIVLFEYVLQKIIQRQIVPHFTRARPAATRFYTLKPLAPDCAVLLSALAHTGQTEPAEIFKAFQNGVPYVRATGITLTLLSRDACGLAEIGRLLLPRASSPADQKEPAGSLRPRRRSGWRDSGKRSGVAPRHRRNPRLPHTAIPDADVEATRCRAAVWHDRRGSVQIYITLPPR